MALGVRRHQLSLALSLREVDLALREVGLAGREVSLAAAGGQVDRHVAKLNRWPKMVAVVGWRIFLPAVLLNLELFKINFLKRYFKNNLSLYALNVYVSL